MEVLGRRGSVCYRWLTTEHCVRSHWFVPPFQVEGWVSRLYAVPYSSTCGWAYGTEPRGGFERLLDGLLGGAREELPILGVVDLRWF